MSLLHTMALVQLLLRIDTSWPLSPIFYCSGHFSALPKLYTSHSFYAPHPFHILHRSATCDPRYIKQSTSSNSSPFSITCIQSLFPYLEHLITLLLATFTLNFLHPHTLPNSLTNIPNFSSESATSAVSSANNSWFISNLPPITLSSSDPFPSTLTFTS